jgi:hypothetical protein
MQSGVLCEAHMYSSYSREKLTPWSHISDLTPDMILALTATASYLQVPVLRDTICKHVSFRSSVRVHMPVSHSSICLGTLAAAYDSSQSDGPPSFQMEFHLPFFALRKAPNADASFPNISGKCLRKWEDLTLLSQDQIGSESEESYRLHKAQLSCVVHGFDEWHWIAYAFEDTRHENDLEDDDDEVVDRQLDSSIVTFGEEDEDPILHLLDSGEKPIWKPRQYFLKAFEVQVRKFRVEWNALVHKLEDDRSEYVRLVPANFDVAFACNI